MLLLAIVDRETTTTTILVHHTSCTSVGYYVFYFLKRSLVSFRSIVGWPAKTKSNGAWIRHFLSSAYWHRVPELNIHIIINNIIVITCLVEQTATTLLRPVHEELRQEGGREREGKCVPRSGRRTSRPQFTIQVGTEIKSDLYNLYFPWPCAITSLSACICET